MNESNVRILAFGAHPDDCDIKAGGLAILHARRGGIVRFVSLTNGAAGHQEQAGARLAQRRQAEAQAAARAAGIEYLVLGNQDGELEVNLANRRRVVELIRSFNPDLVLTHRNNDYHPDHRNTAMLVQDAAYMVTVPQHHPLVPHLMENPTLAYFQDNFQRPYAFQPDIVLDVDAAAETKLDMLDCHVSQVYEWLPYNMDMLDQVPATPQERREWLREVFLHRGERVAERYRDALIARYGAEHGAAVRYAEAFEISEYGAPLTEELRARLFPF